VGAGGDAFEAHADEVAGRVVRGESAVDLLDRVSGTGADGSATFAVQKQEAAKQGEDHPGADAVGNVSVSVGQTMTAEAGLRAVYDQCARQITEAALKMAAEGGGSPEAVEKAARWAVQARNELKVALRARGSVVTKALAEARNIKKYGDKVGPTYDQLIREGKTPKDIIGSAGKANTKLSRAATKLKVAGRLLIAIDLAIVTWEVIEAPEFRESLEVRFIAHEQQPFVTCERRSECRAPCRWGAKSYCGTPAPRRPTTIRCRHPAPAQ